MWISLLTAAALAFEADQALPDDLRDGGGINAERPEANGVINGSDASRDLYPMAGALLAKGHIDLGPYGSGDIFSVMCSSTLIAPDVVILAAHCVDPDALTYGMGTFSNAEYGWSRQADLTEWDGSSRPSGWPEDTVFAADWVFHPDFDLMQLETGLYENFDIALVFLEEPILDVPLGVLITADEASQLALNKPVTVVGWGQQVATNQNQSIPAGTYAIKQWGESYIARLDDAEYQVGLVESDVRKCHGDSGGPSFMQVESGGVMQNRLIGVTSHAYDNTDCFETGGVDTRIDHYLGWIESELRARCEDGTRVWCEEPGIPIGVSMSWQGVGDAGYEAQPGGCSTLPAGALGLWAVGLLGLLRRRRS